VAVYCINIYVIWSIRGMDYLKKVTKLLSRSRHKYKGKNKVVVKLIGLGTVG
jgi:hypothetical protein